MMTDHQFIEEEQHPAQGVVTNEFVRQKLFESATYVKIIESKLLEGKLSECAQYQKLLTANVSFLATLADGQPSSVDHSGINGSSVADSEHSRNFAS